MQQVVKFTNEDVKKLMADHLADHFRGSNVTVSGVKLSAEGVEVAAEIWPKDRKPRQPRLVPHAEAAVKEA